MIQAGQQEEVPKISSHSIQDLMTVVEEMRLGGWLELTVCVIA